jgi:hypothetical protein
MEKELVNHLFDLVERFCASRRMEEATVGRLCAADGRFFLRLRIGKTFTVKKFDEVVRWFSANWPENADWPEGLERPLVVGRES